MDVVYYNQEYSFDNLSLINPTRLQGGAYFSKILSKEEPFLFQTPKSLTKNGLIITSKKTYCDLVFNNDNHKFIQWIEKLEEAIQFLIFEKRHLWFHNEMELEDIEYFFNPSIRLFKKNKYILRSHIYQPKHIKCPISLQIYDEAENSLDISDIKKEQEIICILEVLGIKFTSSSFHIDYCLRQIMVIEQKQILKKCLIKTVSKKASEVKSSLITKNTTEKVIEDTPVTEPTTEEATEKATEKATEAAT